MNLEEHADKITLIHRRDVFKAHEDSVDWLLNRSNVETLLFHEMSRVEGDDAVRRAVIYDNRTKEEKVLEIDGVLVNLGLQYRHWPDPRMGHYAGGQGYCRQPVHANQSAGGVRGRRHHLLPRQIETDCDGRRRNLYPLCTTPKP